MTYPEKNDINFYNKIKNKQEFHYKYYKNILYHQKHQMLLRNFMSPYNHYNSLLLFHFPGSGKTCTSIAIAERHRLEKWNVFILTKNALISKNFMNELFTECSNFVDKDNIQYY